MEKGKGDIWMKLRRHYKNIEKSYYGSKTSITNSMKIEIDWRQKR